MVCSFIQGGSLDDITQVRLDSSLQLLHGYQEKFILRSIDNTLEQAAQGSDIQETLEVSYPWGVCKKRIVVTPRDLVSERVADGLMVGLDGLRGLFQPQ